MIDNPGSTRVRRVAALANKKERLEVGRFLVEGPQAVRELLTHRPQLAEAVFATDGDEPWQREIDRLVAEHDVFLESVTDEVLYAMTDTVNPQGVVAVARMEEVTLETALSGARLVAILHEVRDPGNAGAVLRAADAAGADVVIFSGDSIDPWHPKVVRATTGSIFHLPVISAISIEDATQAARAVGLNVIAADVGGADLTEVQWSLASPTAWVFGNESRGLTDSDRALCDRVIRLPIYGEAESLNLATAASVFLYTTAFAQRA